MSNQQVVTFASATLTYGTNVLDLTDGYGKDMWGDAKYGQPGENKRLWLNVLVTTTFTSSTSAAKFKVGLYTGTSESAPQTKLFETGWITKGSSSPNLVAGQYLVRMPLPAIGMQRYLAVGYTSGVTKFSAGKVDAWIGLSSESPLLAGTKL
jgi:hypothetical protein